MPATSRETAIASVLRRQFGAFSTGQALTAGFSEGSLRRAVQAGRFVRIYPAVYLDTSFPPTEDQLAVAALLACGERSVLSHRPAARRWKLDIPAPLPEVTLPYPLDRDVDGVLVHRSRRLLPFERVHMGQIRLTSAARTLVDIVGIIPGLTAELCLDSLWRRKHVEPAHLLDYLSDPWALNRPGSDILRRLCAARNGKRPPGSDMETLLLRLVRDVGLPVPDTQVRVETPYGPRFLDFAYRDKLTAIETDGFEAHVADQEAFLEERVRQNLVSRQHWRFLRFTWTQVTEDPLAVVVEIGYALGLKPSRWRARLPPVIRPLR